MAYLHSKIPLDISCGAFQPIRFDNMPLSLWRKGDLGVLESKIKSAPERAEGLNEVKEIAARKFGEAILTLIHKKHTIPPQEKAPKIREYADSILAFRYFIFPATVFQIKNFVEKEIDMEDAAPLRSMIGQQEQMQRLILEHGHLSRLQERGDIEGAISEILKAFQSLPQEQQPTSLMEALKNPKTSQNAWKQIRFFYKALMKQGM